MTHLFHIMHMGRQAVVDGDTITYTDDLPPPTQAELEATRPAAEAAWAAQLLADELPAKRDQMAAILDALPIETQAALWATRVAVEQALDRGRLDIARQLVADTAVPAELEATKAAILNLFPSP